VAAPAGMRATVPEPEPSDRPRHGGAARRHRLGTRSEAGRLAGRQRGIGSPHRSGCPRRPEVSAGVCSSAIWASPKSGNSEHTVRQRVRVSRSRAPRWAAVGTRSGGCRGSDRVAANRVALSAFTSRDHPPQRPLASTFLAVRVPHAPSCLAPGERTEHAAPTTPEGRILFIPSHSPFPLRRRSTRVPAGPIFTVTQRCLAESPFFGGCESRVCSNAPFTHIGWARSVSAGQAET
jgi:hypothetical protein